MAKYTSDVADLSGIFKALADESRLRTFNVLQRGELCVCQITELLNLAPSTVSKHMSILRQAGLVESRKEGRWIYYRLTDLPKDTPGGGVRNLVQKQLADSDQNNADVRSLQKILRCDPEELCRKQLQK
jgi:DNA-binding transcriptional ArsR family regulator